jgi:triacylglycerol esterase/lipase EstA (alpha/beta hydrolase family)
MRRLSGSLLTIALAAVGVALVSPAAPAQAAGPRPVVFVHGFGGSASNWTTAQAVFRAAGYNQNQLFAYEYNSFGSNITNAQGLATFVNRVKAQTGASQVDIVNHSMGGLVTGWYVNELGGQSSVRHVASIAGANHGTTSAASCAVFVTCQQMLPGSAFILAYTTPDETPGNTSYATWYSATDGIIIPFTSTILNGARNNLVVGEDHIGFLTNTTVMGQIRAFLAS